MLERKRFIVLQTRKYREADLLVTGLLKSGNKQIFIARGALKSQKRFGGGVLEPTRYIEAVVQSGTTENKWSELREAAVVHEFNGLRKDYERLQVALSIIDWTLRLSPEGGEPFAEVFHLIGRALETLETTAQPHLLHRLVRLKLLALHGVLPPNVHRKEWLQLPLAEHEVLTMNLEDGETLDHTLVSVYQEYAGI